MSAEPEDSKEAMRAKLTELRAHKYHLECEKTLVRAKIRVLEARLGDGPHKPLPELVDAEHEARHDASVSATALRRASSEYAEVLKRCRALAEEAEERTKKGGA